MEMASEWTQIVLYNILLGKKDRRGQAVPEQVLNRELYDLLEALKTRLGAYTEVKLVEARGDSQWGKEETSLIFVITEKDVEHAADELLGQRAYQLNTALSQDEVWIVKQYLLRLISKLAS